MKIIKQWGIADPSITQPKLAFGISAACYNDRNVFPDMWIWEEFFSKLSKEETGAIHWDSQ